MGLGQNIKLLRKQAQLTQDHMVAKLNLMGIDISKSTYAKIETNRMNIKVSEFIAIKLICKAEYEDFFLNLESKVEQLNLESKADQLKET